jgi:chaperonin GroES
LSPKKSRKGDPGQRVALTDVPEDVAPTAGTAGVLPIKMLHDRLLVSLRKEDGDRRSSGGILIPATAQVAKRLMWGEARGVGPNVRQIKVGDQVLFSPEDQHEVEVHGEDLIILRERDVHAVAAERIEESTGLYL